MKSLLLTIACLMVSVNAKALDSDWKLCKGDVIIYDRDVKIVVNAYEHRVNKGRAADLTFIYGGHVLRGSYNTSESTSGNVTLKDANSSFKGNVAIDYGRGTMSLNGKLDLNKAVSDLKATLECETL